MGELVKVVGTIAEAKGWAEVARQAGILPTNTNQAQAMAIVQSGREMGLQPFQSLRSMSFIKGRLTMSVQLQLAMAKRGGVKLSSVEEGDDYCTATLTRESETVKCKYTKTDAEKAGLVVAGGSWTKYQRQMLRWRAIGDGLRLIAPDLVLGLLSPEEAESIDPVDVVESADSATKTEESPAESKAPPRSAPAEKGGGATTPPATPKSEEDEGALRDHLAAVCSEIAKVRGMIRDEGEPDWQAVLFNLTVNAAGKYGKLKTEDIAFKMLKKNGEEWSPLKATISKAERELEYVTKKAEELDGEEVLL
jgi:hypothetical protein